VVGYTPSAISQPLAQLEREAGIVLLERDGRRVRVTAAAHRRAARPERALADSTPPRLSSREHDPEDDVSALRSGVLDLVVSESDDDVEPTPAGGLEQHLLMSEPLLLVPPWRRPAPSRSP
jgi:DNA-binding transcriptional LysR family regulator